MNLKKSACPIWNTPASTKFLFNEYKSWWRSPRVCGQYILTSDGEGEIQTLEDYDRIKLTSWLTEQRRYGNSQPEITREVISESKNKGEQLESMSAQTTFLDTLNLNHLSWGPL